MGLLIKEIPYQDPMLLVTHLPEDKDLVFFDSSAPLSHLSRFSFIAYDPFSLINCTDGRVKIDNRRTNGVPLTVLAKQLNRYKLETVPHIPFTGGLAGFFSYESVKYTEPRIRLSKKDDRSIPDFLLGAFDLVIAFDHLLRKCWIISSGLPETNKKLVKIRAEIRCNELLDLLACTQNKNRREKICLVEKEEIISNLDYQKYCLAIEKTLQYIQAGDIYQANIAQRFSCFLPDGLSDIDLYQRLRQKNPAPFATYIRLGENRILSSSPERFIKVDNRQVLTCPIKGTTKRDAYFRRDQQLARHLSECQKNLAENLMIVDLMRNDLSRVCEFHSVNVPKLFCVESYAEVHHLVSTIEGRLKQEYDLIDLIKATFPGGSITGAPKIRAMEIIDEIETEARGPYCGIITYLNYDGRMDSSITIRSFVLKDKFLTFHVGGGIVADSAPSKEYIETILKASALYTALTEKRIKQYVSVAAKGISINA